MLSAIKKAYAWLKPRVVWLLLAIAAIATLGSVHFYRKAKQEKLRADVAESGRDDLERRITASLSAEADRARVEREKLKKDKASEAKRKDVEAETEKEKREVDLAAASGSLADELNAAIDRGEL